MAGQVRLSRQIMQIAGDALKRNITNLGPLVLPFTEQIKFFCNLLARKALRGHLPIGPSTGLEPTPWLRSSALSRQPAAPPRWGG